MKDGKQIFEQVNLIQDKEPKSKISLATNAPVCSKTTVFLQERKIDILSLEKQL